MFSSRSLRLVLLLSVSALLACSSTGARGPVQGGAGGSEPETPSGGADGAAASGGQSGGAGNAADAAAGGAGDAGSSGSAGADAGDSSRDGAADTGTTSVGAPTTAAVPSSACAVGAVTPPPGGLQTITATGKSRRFIIRTPAAYDGKRPWPVMFAFHGAGGNAVAFENAPFGAIGRMAADRAIRIIPDGIPPGWNRDEPDDVFFIDALMSWLDAKVCYDKAHVYATGHSSGAYFSHRLACDRGTVIRAIATNSGGQRRERPLECKHAVSAWMSTGSNDLPGHVAGTQQARDIWSTLAGCAPTGGNPVPPAPCVAQTGCRPGYAVTFCQHGGGHDLPAFAVDGILDFLFNSKM